MNTANRLVVLALTAMLILAFTPSGTWAQESEEEDRGKKESEISNKDASEKSKTEKKTKKKVSNSAEAAAEYKDEASTEPKENSEDEAEIDLAETQEKDSEDESEDTLSAEEEEEEEEEDTRKQHIKRLQAKRKIIGWVERIRLEPEGALLDAKLTPGSEGNVLHAENIKTFKRKEVRWVRFETQDRLGDTLTIERPIFDESRFRTTDGSVTKRYVVRIPICLSATYVEIDFSLANRNAFEQEVRIGRSALAGQFIIDPSKTKTTQPDCVIPENNN